MRRIVQKGDIVRLAHNDLVRKKHARGHFPFCYGERYVVKEIKYWVEGFAPLIEVMDSSGKVIPGGPWSALLFIPLEK